MKLLICGPRGAGKSTLIRRLIPRNVAVYGFETLYPEDGTDRLYIRPPFDRNAPLTTENCVGRRGSQPGTAIGFPSVFDRYGAALLRNIPAGAAVVMDELGFLERDALGFLQQVEQILTGSYQVLGAIKPLELPHLQRLKTLPEVTVLTLTENSREAVFQQARALLEA